VRSLKSHFKWVSRAGRDSAVLCVEVIEIEKVEGLLFPHKVMWATWE
jgi:hypothetical protein